MSAPGERARVESDDTADLRASILEELGRRFPDDDTPGTVAPCEYRAPRLTVWTLGRETCTAVARCGRGVDLTAMGTTERGALETLARAIGLPA